MARREYKNFAVDQAGSVVPGAAFEVRSIADDSLATLYAARSGATTVTNPGTATNDGSIDDGLINFWLDDFEEHYITIGSGVNAITYPLPEWPDYTNRAFASRAAMAGVWANYVSQGIAVPVGTVWTADGLSYEYDGTTTDISDMSGWKPYGRTWWVEQFGAVDTPANTLATFQALAAALESGVTVKGLATSYTFPLVDRTSTESSRVVLTTSGVIFDFPAGTEFINMPLYFKGTFGSEITVGATGFGSGDSEINTASAHGLAAGDYVQCLSQRNANSPDAGIWQMGSQNPTTLELKECRLSEIHRIADVPTTTTATIYDTIIYDDYLDNVSGLSDPMTGITAATIRKITPVDHVTFKGAVFKYDEGTANWTGIVARGAAYLRFEGCEFRPATDDGQCVNLTDCYVVRFVDCEQRQNVHGGYGGAAENCFVIGGGCHDVVFETCTLVGGAQVIDFTSGMKSNEIDPDSAADYKTVQAMTLDACRFYSCGDGFTTHPCTYNLNVSGCSFINCDTGGRVRSRQNSITGNTFLTSTACLVLSNFYEDTVISGNTMIAMDTVSDWEPLTVTPLGSDGMNDNAIERFLFTNNTINGSQNSDARIVFRHYNNGAISAPLDPSFALFTDAVKIAVSNYVISNNVFDHCYIDIEKWINGVRVINNQFSGSIGGTHYIDKADDGARLEAWGNYFASTEDAITAGSDDAGLTYGYVTGNRIGRNYSNGGTLFSTITNSNPTELFSDSDGIVGQDYVVQNGGTFKSRRTSGAATLYLEAKAEDGTSDETISVFGTSATSGTKTFQVKSKIETDNGAVIDSGTGDPEGAVSAPVSSLWLRTDGGPSTVLYVKESGSGNTGWAAVASDRPFATRAAMVTVWSAYVSAGVAPPVGTVWTADGLSYEYDGSTTDISDMSGWKPLSPITPNHFLDNATPGTTDMGSALTSWADYQRANGVQGFLLGETYYTTSTVNISGCDIQGVFSGYENVGGTIVKGNGAINVLEQSDTAGADITYRINGIGIEDGTIGLAMSYAVNCLVENFFIRNCTDGIRLGESGVIGALWCQFKNGNIEATQYALDIQGTANGNANLFDTVVFDANTACVRENISGGIGSVANHYINCEFKGDGRGLQLGSSRSTRLDNPYFETVGPPIAIVGTTRGLEINGAVFAGLENTNADAPAFIWHNTGAAHVSLNGGFVYVTSGAEFDNLALVQSDATSTFYLTCHDWPAESVAASGWSKLASGLPTVNDCLSYEADYTPTWEATTDPTIGNGSISGRYSISGKTVTCHIEIVFGSTTTAGSGNYVFGAPFSCVTDAVASYFVLDSGTGYYGGVGTLSGGTNNISCYEGGGTGQLLDSNTPITWASGDKIKISVTYEMG